MHLKFNIFIFIFCSSILLISGALVPNILRISNQHEIETVDIKEGILNDFDVPKHSPYNDTVGYNIVVKDGKIKVPFIIISDQDRDAKIEKSGKTVYASTVEMGMLYVNEDYSGAKVLLSTKTENFTTKLNYDGRGAEFSDLKWFNGMLLTVDDKTGVIYKLLGTKLIAEAILHDGIDQDRLYKGEWMTVKDKKLYVGGYGKEYTSGDGNKVENYNPMYIKVFDTKMGQETVDWKDVFTKVRKSIGVEFPAYIVNEAVQWSKIHKKWFFLPRKVSQNPYTDADAEIAGSNIIITANEDFTQFTNVTVGNIIKDQGFSAFQFVPGTKDNVIIAIKSKETEKDGMSSYLMVFKVDGTVLYGPRRIPGKFKMEGLEFLNWKKYLNACKKS